MVSKPLMIHLDTNIDMSQTRGDFGLIGAFTTSFRLPVGAEACYSDPS